MITSKLPKTYQMISNSKVTLVKFYKGISKKIINLVNKIERTV